MGILLLEVFTRKEPYSEPPYDKWSKWGNKKIGLFYRSTLSEIEKFVSGGNRIAIPKEIHPKIRDLISKCWDQTETKRPDFNVIVKVRLMSWIPYLCRKNLSGEQGSAIPISTHTFFFYRNESIKTESASPVRVSEIYVPAGILLSVGLGGRVGTQGLRSQIEGHHRWDLYVEMEQNDELLRVDLPVQSWSTTAHRLHHPRRQDWSDLGG